MFHFDSFISAFHSRQPTHNLEKFSCHHYISFVCLDFNYVVYNRVMLKATQLKMDFVADEKPPSERNLKVEMNRRANKLDLQDRAFHDWYRFVLSYPPHLVRRYIDDFGLTEKSVVLDPFCGTGTTLVEAKLNHIKSIGLEANPVTHFVSSVKINWGINPDILLEHAYEVANEVLKVLISQGIDDNQVFDQSSNIASLRTLSEEASKLILNGSISPLPLHKILVLLEHINQHSADPSYSHWLTAFTNALVYKISNLHFGPEVGVGKPKIDIPVVANWLSEVRKIANDLHLVDGKVYPEARVYLADARQLRHLLEVQSVDAVITSPPYPNEKDYTILKPGAQLAYVVGDQASYLQVMIRTGELLADLAKALGYEVTRIDLFRTRKATATKADLREEVLILRWPGTHTR
jgi:hypothetical protein